MAGGSSRPIRCVSAPRSTCGRRTRTGTGSFPAVHRHRQPVTLPVPRSPSNRVPHRAPDDVRQDDRACHRSRGGLARRRPTSVDDGWDVEPPNGARRGPARPARVAAPRSIRRGCHAAPDRPRVPGPAGVASAGARRRRVRLPCRSPAPAARGARATRRSRTRRGGARRRGCRAGWRRAGKARDRRCRGAGRASSGSRATPDEDSALVRSRPDRDRRRPGRRASSGGSLPRRHERTRHPRPRPCRRGYLGAGSRVPAARSGRSGASGSLPRECGATVRAREFR